MSNTIQETKRNTDLQRLQEQNSALAYSVETLQENLADVTLALDNIGWNPMGSDFDASEIPLSTLKEVSQTTRALLAINPLAKRGVGVRTSYIWGEGITFEGIEEDHPVLTSKHNKKFLFSPQAQEQLEACAATDGNVFVLVAKPGRRVAGGRTAKVSRIPMSQITGTVSDPENNEDVWFYRREWEVVTENLQSGQEVKKTKIEYYPATDYDFREHGKPARIRNKPVNWDAAILAKSPNKQTGWKWGTPDLMTTIFWNKAYKEFLENSATLVKAYSRFAFKVTAQSKGGVQGAATKVAQVPSRDPQTGQVQDVGGTAVMGMGNNLQTIGKSGGSVDFDAGLPLAAMVAAGLDIPLTDLTSDAGSANRSGSETLQSTTVKAMKARQKFWSDFYAELFEYLGIEGVKVLWPAIDSDPVYRQIQAVVQAAALNVLHAEEVRDLFKYALNIQNDKGLPTEEELGLLILQLQKQEEQAEKAAKLKADAAKNPETSNPSYGDNGNREDDGAHNYDPTDGRGE